MRDNDQNIHNFFILISHLINNIIFNMNSKYIFKKTTIYKYYIIIAIIILYTKLYKKINKFYNIYLKLLYHCIYVIYSYSLISIK